VTLPYVPVRAGGSAREAGPVAPSDAGVPTLRGVRVLMVDDDAEFLELSAVMLRTAGAEVRTASSAFRAYETLEAWQPNVVLTDLAMPGEDGFTLLLAMRAAFDQRRLKVPIIAVTAYGTPDNHARADQAGFDLYLTKPIDPLRLTSVVAEAVRPGR
jgi:CheY-like chemotaxis protein